MAGAAKTLSACSLLNAGRNNYGNETKSKTLATNSKRYFIRNFTQPCRISHEKPEMWQQLSRKCNTKFRTSARHFVLSDQFMEISLKLRCDHFGAVLY